MVYATGRRARLPLNYEVGDIIYYGTFLEGLRKVRVTSKEKDIKNGAPGFGGDLLNGNVPDGFGVWGYDQQIVRVEKA